MGGKRKSEIEVVGRPRKQDCKRRGVECCGGEREEVRRR